ncbi:YlxR family protein [Arthrobacter sp. NPDC090010]|uniref:YlxR family protein n=1 Tax=Arthrobacter sp. NPDC090010 TaxID=3363942 RepID=UPI0037FC4B68
MAAQKSAPLRTCIGCRRREPQELLVRLTIEPASHGVNRVVLDARRRMGGRGAWLHPATECLALAQRKRAFARAFRGAADSGGLDQDLASHSVPEAAQAPPGTTVQSESGSEI